MLEGKYILLGVSSSVACYKALELVRLFRKAGAEVRVNMTENATKMIRPVQFEALADNPVYSDVFSRSNQWEVEHVVAADWGDAFVMAPATANIIAKMAHGIADDAPTTLFLAFPGQVFVAPAMHTEMWNHPATRHNLRVLESRGVRIIQPESGGLASGDVGTGRLAKPQTIFNVVEEYFSATHSFRGKKVLITAGPTREPLDPVRFLSNRSSGQMGYALAEEMNRRGAEVVLVSGPTSLEDPPGIQTERICTAMEMRDRVMEHFDDTDIFIFSAAVSDYRPERTDKEKIKKTGDEMQLSLVKNPDIAAEAGKRSGEDRFIAGFAAETSNLEESARKKMKDKNMNMIIANDVSKEDSGMESFYNDVQIISRRGSTEHTGRKSKTEIARHIINAIEREIFHRKES